MSINKSEIKCAACHLALQGPSDPKPQDRFSCPNCGVGDSFENVMREVRNQLKEHAASRVTQMMRDATRGNKHVKFTAKPRMKRNYRFVIEPLV